MNDILGLKSYDFELRANKSILNLSKLSVLDDNQG